MKQGACLAATVCRLFLKPALVAALFEVEVIPETVPANGGVKELGSILGGTGAQTVEAKTVLIVLAIFAVLTAGVHLAEDQFPVVAFFLFVIIYGAAASEVLDLNAEVFITGDDDGISVTLPGFVDGVAENLKYRMLAAFQIIGAEDNRRTFADPLFALELSVTSRAAKHCWVLLQWMPKSISAPWHT